MHATLPVGETGGSKSQGLIRWRGLTQSARRKIGETGGVGRRLHP
jgi:hypothetical protein